MSRYSELEKEIQSKTKDFEKVREEKEKAEREMKEYTLNLDLASKIEYVQTCLKNTKKDYLKEFGWSFVFGKYKNDESYIQFKDEWIIGFPNDPDLFDELIEVIYKILEKKKEKLKGE